MRWRTGGVGGGLPGNRSLPWQRILHPALTHDGGAHGGNFYELLRMERHKDSHYVWQLVYPLRMQLGNVTEIAVTDITAKLGPFYRPSLFLCLPILLVFIFLFFPLSLYFLHSLVFFGCFSLIVFAIPFSLVILFLWLPMFFLVLVVSFHSINICLVWGEY